MEDQNTNFELEIDETKDEQIDAMLRGRARDWNVEIEDEWGYYD